MAEIAWRKSSQQERSVQSSTDHPFVPDRTTRPVEQSELEIVAAAKLNVSAFEPLYAHYHPIVFGYCYRRLGHTEQAADLSSQIFLKVLRALPNYQAKPGATFRSWLFAIAHNEVIDNRRRNRPERSLDIPQPDDRPGIELVDTNKSPEDQVLFREQQDHIRLALATLPERRRQIVELRLAGLSGAEIGATLGMTLSAVKSAQFHAYAALRDVLDHPSNPEFPDAI